MRGQSGLEWTVRYIKNTLHPKTSHRTHLATDKNEIKLWSKMSNSKTWNLEAKTSKSSCERIATEPIV